LIDVQIPDVIGLETLVALNERGVFLRAIVLSRLPDAEIETTAKMRGAVDYLEIPLDPEILLAAIRNGLTRFQSQVVFIPVRRTETTQKRARSPIGQSRWPMPGGLNARGVS
jgi:DNA-binding response OmpR family regulator